MSIHRFRGSLAAAAVVAVATLPATALHAHDAAHAGSGHVIVVRMTHDSAGQHFIPSTIHAHTGDTLRFVNGAGRHNVDFPAALNGKDTHLPAPTPLLEREGASVDIPVALSAGTYRFQCDPHASMGMVGSLVVDPRPERHARRE